MKQLIGAVIIAGIVSTGCNKKMATVSAPMMDTTVMTVMDSTPYLKNSIDSFSYAAGINIGESMKTQGIIDVNTEAMAKGMQDAIKNLNQLMSTEQAGQTLQQKLQEFAEIKAAAEKAKTDSFFNSVKAKPGVIVLPNGLMYEVQKAAPATNPKPALSDTAVVHYTGMLVDGKIFDSSVERGEPATFPLTGVIKGWTEILQLMPKGSKWKVYIPSELGYGEQGAGGVIPPNAPLIFEIELLDIKAAARK